MATSFLSSFPLFQVPFFLFFGHRPFNLFCVGTFFNPLISNAAARPEQLPSFRSLSRPFPYGFLSAFPLFFFARDRWTFFQNYFSFGVRCRVSKALHDLFHLPPINEICTRLLLFFLVPGSAPLFFPLSSLIGAQSPTNDFPEDCRMSELFRVRLGFPFFPICFPLR